MSTLVVNLYILITPSFSPVLQYSLQPENTNLKMGSQDIWIIEGSTVCVFCTLPVPLSWTEWLPAGHWK